MSQFDNVSVLKKANVYFDGKCVSHSVVFPDGSRKTVGVILPSSLVFNTGAPEVMDVIEGSARVRPAGSSEWTTYSEGDSFSVPGDSSFTIEVAESFQYVCSFE